MTDIEITPAPVPLELMVKRYQCTSCRFRRATKKDVVEHMARCWYDRANRSCKTCLHFSSDDGDPETGAPAVIWCGARSEEMQYEATPVVGCPLWRDRDEEEDEPAEGPWDRDARALGGGDAR